MSKSFSIGLIEIPAEFIGKKVKDFDLYNKYKIHAIAVKRDKEFIAINENYTILDYDELVISGKNDDIEEFDKHRE